MSPAEADMIANALDRITKAIEAHTRAIKAFEEPLGSIADAMIGIELLLGQIASKDDEE